MLFFKDISSFKPSAKTNQTYTEKNNDREQGYETKEIRLTQGFRQPIGNQTNSNNSRDDSYQSSQKKITKGNCRYPGNQIDQSKREQRELSEKK